MHLPVVQGFFQKCTEFLKADILIRLCLSPFFFFCHLCGGSPLRCAGDLHVAVIYCWLHPSIVYLGKSHNKPPFPSLLNISTSCLVMPARFHFMLLVARSCCDLRPCLNAGGTGINLVNYTWSAGAYDSEEAAARAYDLAALKYWGPETLLNFPVSSSCTAARLLLS